MENSEALTIGKRKVKTKLVDKLLPENLKNEYFDSFKSARLTLDELKLNIELSGMTDNELEKIADSLLSLAIIAMNGVYEEKKIMDL